MKRPRTEPSVAMLTDGRVLIAGGDAKLTRGCELYDPATGQWSDTGKMVHARINFTLTTLKSGKVLATGNDTAETELYDPVTGQWSVTDKLNHRRDGHSAVLLEDGRVLAGGGGAFEVGELVSCEIYDPATGRWSQTGDLNEAGVFQLPFTLLPGGDVLRTGGDHTIGNPKKINDHLSRAERYSPATGRWTLLEPMSIARSGHRATRLKNGMVLITGGFYDDQTGADKVTDSAQLFIP